ncbi:MAG TPA: CDP-alcohol phosphatidyltransferase family protein [Puia sp.]|nr:CDP-alcohol phosphatidyltransferase family protein [Puia sp.]
MAKPVYYIVNGITLYRVLAAPLLLLLVFRHEWGIFKWLLVLSFLTDAVDGYIARKYKVVSSAGAVLDSIGDDLTVLVAIIGLIVFDPIFIHRELLPVIILGVLYVFQILAALIRYGKLTSFHTWLAKIAAVSQGVFLILTFFLSAIPQPLFWIAVILTALDLTEEIILVILLPRWKSDVHGLSAALRINRAST